MLNERDLAQVCRDKSLASIEDARIKFDLAKEKLAQLNKNDLLREELQEVQALIVDAITDLNIVNANGDGDAEFGFTDLKNEVDDFEVMISSLKIR